MPSSSLIARSYSGSVVGVGAEARDDVVAGLAAADRVGELAPAPVIQLQVARVAEQAVQAAELLVDGGVFERRVEDVDRLILARHALAILPLVVSRPPLVAGARGGESCALCADMRPAR